MNRLSTLPTPRELHTTHSRVLPLNIEAITEGRLRTKRNLQRAIEAIFGSSTVGGLQVLPEMI